MLNINNRQTHSQGSADINVNNKINFLNGSEDIEIMGKHGDRLYIAPNQLATHIAILGGSGFGKTNALNSVVSKIAQRMTENDILIVFDVKGGFIEKFLSRNDKIISSKDYEQKVHWNLIKEVGFDGEAKFEENAREIAYSIFEKEIKTSSSPYFPKAAAELFMALIIIQLKEMQLGMERDNSTLYSLCMSSAQNIIDQLNSWPEIQSYSQHIDKDNDQTAGVLSELRLVTGSVLSSNFRNQGDFSIREMIQNPNGNKLFIEYDVGIGEVLSPIYSLLFDYAIKESLRGNARGKVYLVMDEFRLLPYVKHISDGISLGREMGLCLILASQNIGQIRETYGSNLGDGMVASFGIKIVFNNNDFDTRHFICNSFGKEKRLSEFQGSRTQGMQKSLQEEYVILDSDIRSLDVGESYIKLGKEPPRRFSFELYERR